MKEASMPIQKNAPGLIAPALLSLVLLAGCEQPPAAPPPKGAVPVGVVTVATQNVSVTSELAGRTSPFKIAEIRPQINGIIEQRLFREGADVKSGEVLYQIDPSLYQAALDNAEAAQAKAQANLATLKLKADRYGELIKVNAVAKQDLDDAQAAAKQAAADVEAAKAAVNTARINLNYTRITSPIAGRIGISTVTAGALVTANQANFLTTVQQLDPIYVDVIQPSSELIRMKHELENGSLKRAGPDAAKVRLLLENNQIYALDGKLELADITVGQGTGTVTLRAVFPNPKHDLLPGMFVRALLEEGINEQGMLVPQQGVTHDNRGRATALVVEKDGKVALRVLELGEAQGDKWVVRKGLNPGDQLIVEGLQKVRPGVDATATPWSAASAVAAASAVKP
jgi:membrane fusion protein (multidrug efflux system)